MTEDLKKKRLDYGNQLKLRLAELHKGKQFHDKQLELFNAIFIKGYKRVFVFKGRKAGGTEALMYPIARIIGTVPSSAAYFIGPTQKAQSEIIWDNRRLHSFIPREWKPVTNEQQKRIRLGINDSFVKVEGADNPDAARGWEGDIFVWDERKDHNPLSLEWCYPNVLPRDAIWIENGTPPTQKTNDYYIKHQSIQNDPDWYILRMTAWDNPFLPGGHEWLKKEKEKYYREGRGWIWEVEWEGRYVFSGGRKVLPSFGEKNQSLRTTILPMLERDKNQLQWICSIDPGYATCFAVLFAAYNPYTSQIFFVDEIYSTTRDQNAAREMWPTILEKQKRLYNGKWTTLYDSAAASFAVEVNSIMKESGERSTVLVPTKKERGDEENYFRTLNSACVDQGQLYVAADACPKFTWEAEEYELTENTNGTLVYPDKNNHQLDNARYIMKYLRYTPALKQGETKIVPVNGEPTRIQDHFRKQQRKHDLMGYGGEDADFSLEEVL